MSDSKLRKSIQKAVRERVSLADSIADTINFESITGLKSVETRDARLISLVSGLLAAKHALTISPDDPSSKDLTKVFEYVGLDAEKPHHWRVLLEGFVRVCFSDAGAPEKWSDDGILTLVDDIKELEVKRPDLSKASSTIIAKELLRSKKATYSMKADTLRKLVDRARDPTRTPAWALDGSDLTKELLTRAAQRSGLDLTEAKLIQLLRFTESINRSVIQAELDPVALAAAVSLAETGKLQVASEQLQEIARKAAHKGAGLLTRNSDKD